MSPEEVVAAQCTMLAVTGRTDPSCQPVPATGGVPGPALPDPETLARQAMLRMRIPDAPVQFGPDPKVNEWKMAVVGYPYWLWTEGPDQHTATITEQGITITLTARRTSTGFDLGDGTITWCAFTTPHHPAVAPGQPSPSCGHRYTQPSPRDRPYQLKATTVWAVSWSALGHSGTLDLQRQGPTRTIEVGELVSVRTGN